MELRYTICMSADKKSTQHIDYYNRKKQKGSNRGGVVKPFIIALLITLMLGAGVLAYIVFRNAGNDGNGKHPDGNTATGVGVQIYDIEDTDINAIKADESETAMSSDDGSRYGALLADEELCRQNHIYGKDAAYADEISMLFAGDISFADGYDNMGSLRLRGGEIDAAFNEETLDIMREADIFMVNNEFTYSTRGTPTENKQYTLRAQPDTVRYLDDMGVDIVSLANNHTYDYGEVSLLDTLDTLESADMPYVGAGRNIEEAMKPSYFIVHDVKIAIVAATQIEKLDYPDTKGATDTSAGVFRCWNSSKVFDVIRQAKEESDYVVVYVHWGTEMMEQTDWAQDELAPKLADAGADLIIGDHPHILQKIDYIGDVPVIYSLGNYWFNGKTRDTGLFEVTLDLEGRTNTLRFIPALQANSTTNILTGEEKQRVLNYMQSISPKVYIDSEGYVTRK